MHLNGERWNNFRIYLQRILIRAAMLLEYTIAALLILSILVAIYDLLKDFFNFAANGSTSTFHDYLGMMFNIVIGIEFLKMLCRHNLSTVIEVLMFAIARMMIVEETTSFENLLSVISIAALFFVRKYLYIPGLDDKESHDDHI